MARIKKKGTHGQVKNYITRTQAVRKLQVSLQDFRRLCIFKGIYPREPRNRKKASKTSTPSTTFYYTRDIQYLLHEPLLNKFRDHKALAKKIGKALGRNEVSDAQRMEKTLTPRMTLDHVIKERYPTFVDALRDLDDALSMLFLFANLPQTEAVPPKTIALCQRLCLEFEHYLIRTHSLRKSFLSIKGIYYQATIQGQDILWLVPYKFVQRMTGDIDFRIMGTFIEFYTTLLGFVNYRLYTSIGLVYPPKFDLQSDERGGELDAFTLEGQGIDQTRSADEQLALTGTETSEKAQAEADKLLGLPASDDVPPSSYATAPETTSDITETPAGTENAELDSFPAPIDPTSDALIQPSISTDVIASLFEPFTFYLSRETPRHPLELIVRAFGCRRVGWDTILGDGAYTSDEADKRITHQIVDRPSLPLPDIPADVVNEAGETQIPSGRLRPGERVPGRTYVQPQWIWDCINAGKLLRADLYAPGAVLPPHLSPWVKPRKGDYDPTISLAEQEIEGEAEAAAVAAEREAEMADEEDDELAKAGGEEVDGTEDEGSEGEEVAGVRGDEEARDMEDDLLAQGGKEVAGAGGMDVELAASDDDEEDDEEADEAAEGEWSGFDEEEDEDEDQRAARQHQLELEAEARGAGPLSSSPAGLKADAGSTPGKALKRSANSDIAQKAARRRKEQDEEVERQKMMMSRRKRKMFEKMQYSNRKKDDEAEKLRAKRRRIEQGLAK